MGELRNQLTTGVEGVCGVRVARFISEEGESERGLSSDGLYTLEVELLN